MTKNKQIAIIIPDCFQRIGLQSIGSINMLTLTAYLYGKWFFY